VISWAGEWTPPDRTARAARFSIPHPSDASTLTWLKTVLQPNQQTAARKSPSRSLEIAFSNSIDHSEISGWPGSTRHRRHARSRAGTSRCQPGERAISRAASSPSTSTRVAGIGKVRLTCPTEVRAVLRQHNRAAPPLRKSRAGSAEIRCHPERAAASRRTETSSVPAAALRGPAGPDPGCRGAACRDSPAPARGAD
jgi:hypothetical protein